jgi:hypothetical protein
MALRTQHIARIPATGFGQELRRPLAAADVMQQSGTGERCVVIGAQSDLHSDCGGGFANQTRVGHAAGQPVLTGN